MKMNRAESIWFLTLIFGTLVIIALDKQVPERTIFWFFIPMFSFAAQLGAKRWMRAEKERKEIEAKYTSQDAELLSQSTKNHG